MLSTRLWVRDFPISSALCLVSLLQGSTPPSCSWSAEAVGGGGVLAHTKPWQLDWVCAPIIV